MSHKQILSHFAELSTALLEVDREQLQAAIDTLALAQARRRSVWIVGNGGSAATASHFANDLTKMCGIKAIAIPDITPTVTAYGNDTGWENMFAFPMDVFFELGDVIVAISCSGKSPNILQAVNLIENLIVMTGDNLESPLATHRAQSVLIAPHSDITIQEDIHIAMCHAIAKALAQ